MRLSKTLSVVSLSLAVLLTSCDTNPVQAQRCYVPPKPILPELTIEQSSWLETVRPEVYKTLSDRELTLRAYIIRLSDQLRITCGAK